MGHLNVADSEQHKNLCCFLGYNLCRAAGLNQNFSFTAVLILIFFKYVLQRDINATIRCGKTQKTELTLEEVFDKVFLTYKYQEGTKILISSMYRGRIKLLGDVLIVFMFNILVYEFPIFWRDPLYLLAVKLTNSSLKNQLSLTCPNRLIYIFRIP